jgi:long-chain acyl-CoA synthetase
LTRATWAQLKPSGAGSKDQVAARKAAVEQELTEHLAKVNSGLEPTEQLAFFCVVQEEWATENGFLTPSLKIKRARIEEAYAAHVAGWYAQRSKVVWAEATPGT